MRKAVFFLPVLAALLASCSATPRRGPASLAEEFITTDTYSRPFPGTDESACEAARRALLSQGYVISLAKPAQVQGRKNFQPQGEVHEQIEFNVVCAAESRGSNSATVFANAVRDRYALKKLTNSASLGVGVLGSVSFPFGYTDDAMVKVASETIPNPGFYESFFGLVERYLGEPVLDDAERQAGSDVQPAGNSSSTE